MLNADFEAFFNQILLDSYITLVEASYADTDIIEKQHTQSYYRKR